MLPGVLDTCMPGFTGRDEFCKFYLQDFTEYGYLLDKKINYDTLPDLLEEYGTVDNMKAIYESSKSPLFNELTNPGVQTNIIFSSMLGSLSFFGYEENPKVKTAMDKISYPTESRETMGDGQVLNTSALVPGFKWAEDFQNGQPGAKPVNLIEVCSVWKRRTSVFEIGKKTVDNNSYFGYDCDCKGDPTLISDGGNCQHVPFVEDPKLVNFVLNSSMDGVAQVQSETTQAFEN